MELKSDGDDTWRIPIHCSNCTFMELKLPLHVKKLAVMVKFKLYLYGIEIVKI